MISLTLIFEFMWVLFYFLDFLGSISKRIWKNSLLQVSQLINFIIKQRWKNCENIGAYFFGCELFPYIFQLFETKKYFKFYIREKSITIQCFFVLMCNSKPSICVSTALVYRNKSKKLTYRSVQIHIRSHINVRMIFDKKNFMRCEKIIENNQMKNEF